MKKIAIFLGIFLAVFLFTNVTCGKTTASDIERLEIFMKKEGYKHTPENDQPPPNSPFAAFAARTFYQADFGIVIAGLFDKNNQRLVGLILAFPKDQQATEEAAKVLHRLIKEFHLNREGFKIETKDMKFFGEYLHQVSIYK